MAVQRSQNAIADLMMRCGIEKEHSYQMTMILRQDAGQTKVPHPKKRCKNNALKNIASGAIFLLSNCSCFVLFPSMSSTLYQDPSLIIPQRPLRVRFQCRHAGLGKARGAMRDFTLLLALAWGAAEVALMLAGG